MSDAEIIYITCKDKQEALNISDQLLQAKLIACSNIIDGMTSVFFWQDQVQNNNEVVLILKTLSSHFKKIEDLVNKIHSYQVPCIVSIPLSNCSEPYLQWIKEQIK